MHPAAVLTGLVRDLLSTVLPVECAGCGSPIGSPCPDCAAALVRAVPAVVGDRDALGVPLAATAEYGGPVRSMLVAHKERGRYGLTRPLGAALADAVVIALDRADQLDPRGPRRVELVPVPSRAGAVRDRGHDSVRALATEAARVLSRGGLPATVIPSLRVTGPLRDQVGLSAVQRRLNVSGALVAAPVASRRDSVTDGGDAAVVVVDDITTTGATMAESVRALRDAGHRVQAAAVVAHRPRFASGSGAGRP